MQYLYHYPLQSRRTPTYLPCRYLQENDSSPSSGTPDALSNLELDVVAPDLFVLADRRILPSPYRDFVLFPNDFRVRVRASMARHKLLMIIVLLLYVTLTNQQNVQRRRKRGIYKALITASAYSCVLALPPRSPVIVCLHISHCAQYSLCIVKNSPCPPPTP